MTGRDFCYWLQGFLELRSAGHETGGFSKEQVDCIEKHLALVFKHEIDPSAGPPEHQAVLNDLHTVPVQPFDKHPFQPAGGSPLIRC